MGREAECRTPGNCELVSEYSKQLRADLDELKKAVAKHSVYIVNTNNDICEITASMKLLTPQKPDWLKIILAGITLLTIIMSAQIWVQSNFENRPTKLEVQEQIKPIKESIADIGDKAHHMQRAQSVQKVVTERVETQQKEILSKLNALLSKRRRR